MIQNEVVDAKDRELLQWLQDEFPVVARPWAAGGARLGMAEDELLSRVRRLSAQGVIRSVHTILDARKMGSGRSTLMAMRVPEEKIPDIVSIVNGYPHVTHNYRRENVYNLWFTVNTRDGEELTEVTGDIRRRTGVQDADILDLRTVRVFKIDVRFPFTRNGSRFRRAVEPIAGPVEMDETDRGILRITQRGIPLVHEPFREISEQMGIDQAEVITRLERQVRSGVVKRIGGSVNQRKLGIVANAVVAWKVPESLVEEKGRALSRYDAVTHCYERRSVTGNWEYNLFTVLHGYDRGSVEQCAERLSGEIGIRDYCVLFSDEQFKRTSVIHELAAGAGTD